MNILAIKLQEKLQSRYIQVESESCSVMSNSLQPHELYSPWNSLWQDTGMGNLSLLQIIFPTQGLNLGLLHCRWIFFLPAEPQGKPRGKFDETNWEVVVISHLSLKEESGSLSREHVALVHEDGAAFWDPHIFQVTGILPDMLISFYALQQGGLEVGGWIENAGVLGGAAAFGWLLVLIIK